jgi:hypothetical protein
MKKWKIHVDSAPLFIDYKWFNAMKYAGFVIKPSRNNNKGPFDDNNYYDVSHLEEYAMAQFILLYGDEFPYITLINSP